MNNILNAQDAFNALRAGKTVLCRHILGEFDSLDQFPATVFALPEHEFCIQIELVELAGFKFTKPIALEDVQPNQDLFVIQPHGVIHHFKFDNSDFLADCIINGFAQRDAKNAELHLKAFCKFFSLDYYSIEHTNIQIVDKTNDVDHWQANENNESTSLDDILGPVNDQKSTSSDVVEIQTPAATIDYKPKQKRPTKKEIEAHKDVLLDAIAKCISAEEVATTCHGSEKIGFTTAQLNAVELAKNAKLESLVAEKATAESEAEKLFNQNTADVTGPELSVLCEAFIEDIEKSLSIEDLSAIRHRINANGVLTESEHAELAKHIDLKTASFDVPEAPVQKKYIEEEESKYQAKLIDLKKRVDESNTPAEVNAVTKYTNAWSAEQRQPLITYMHKRLEELQQEKVAKQPSLMVQIQNAPDLTALDSLEIDVSGLDPVAQPEMMRIVRLRRTELEQPANEASIDEDLP
ncbi:hypothetical protein [Acinetobacter courvalinii]|uniref:hypothetical protein n=1 Tax=Acinetobacter courvalinii TaxID=280147 RepID=UPI0019004214|nr:hypothetical protein [Acinetobacter courvalinii]MBJ9958370.1 hypothetical protein [Acinetobacter courvalinii]